MEGSGTAVRFAGFVFDPTDGLRQGGVIVPLRPRSLAVLRALLERRSRVVSRSEILDLVWSDVIVGPAIVNTSIAEIRRALGDDPRAPRFIQTVHRRGFRFIADTETSGLEDAVAVEPASPAGEGQDVEAGAERPLVGRKGALAQLDDCLESVRAGSRLSVFLTGGMGIGKTSLLRAFATRHGSDGPSSADVAWGQCVWLPDPAGAPEPFHPVLDALDRLLRSSAGPRVREVLARCAPSWPVHLPGLFDGNGVSAEVLAERGPVRMLRELCVALEQMTAERPLVLILEDLHWADEATVALIDMLATRAERSELLLLLTFRPADAYRAMHPIVRLRRVLRHRAGIRDLPLAPLGPDAVRAMLLHRFGWESVPPQITRTIHRRTGGHPLLVEALCDGLHRAGAVDGAAQLTVPLETLGTFAPPGFRALLEHELELLDAEQTALLQAASVVGYDFSLDELARATGMPEEEARVACLELHNWSSLIAQCEGIEGGAGETRFAFRAESIADALRARVPRRRRAELLARLTDPVGSPDGPTPASGLDDPDVGTRREEPVH